MWYRVGVDCRRGSDSCSDNVWFGGVGVSYIVSCIGCGGSVVELVAEMEQMVFGSETSDSPRFSNYEN